MTSTYELALVLNGKLEDDARAEALEKVQTRLPSKYYESSDVLNFE